MRISRTARWAAGLVAGVLAAALLAACSGAVTDNTGATSTTALQILPSTATLYSDLPTTFSITGGTGTYIVISSDQNVVPAVGTVNANSFTIVPTEVVADTPVTLTVRDTGTATPVTATLTVKPRTISNTVTVTPSASQSAACGTAVCSGGDAEVKVVLQQNGSPLPNRTVRFDVVSGDVRIITSDPGQPETLALSGTTTSDSTGTARMRVRVLDNAAPQTALLRVTDTSSGFTQTTSVTIASSTNAPLSANPSTVRFTGPDPATCSTGVSAQVILAGGRPPYTISQPPGFQLDTHTVNNSGGTFTVTSTGQCAQESTGGGSGGVTIAIVDSNGATVSVTVFNNTAPSTTTTTAFTVSPTAVTLDSCGAVATVALIGGAGSGTYFAASGNSAVGVNVAGQTATIQRVSVALGSVPLSTPVNVAFSDGKTAVQVVVTLTGTAQTAACP